MRLSARLPSIFTTNVTAPSQLASARLRSLNRALPKLGLTSVAVRAFLRPSVASRTASQPRPQRTNANPLLVIDALRFSSGGGPHLTVRRPTGGPIWPAIATAVSALASQGSPPYGELTAYAGNAVSAPKRVLATRRYRPTKARSITAPPPGQACV